MTITDSDVLLGTLSWGLDANDNPLWVAFETCNVEERHLLPGAVVELRLTRVTANLNREWKVRQTTVLALSNNDFKIYVELA